MEVVEWHCGVKPLQAAFPKLDRGGIMNIDCEHMFRLVAAAS